MRKQYVSVFLPLILFMLVLAAPASFFHMPGLTIVEQRVLAIFVLAAFCWILEPIPIFATSVAIIVLELFMISKSGLPVMLSGQEAEGFGKLLSYQEIMATFASPIIMLFLGGFFLAMAATKYRLDLNLARVLLKPFGANPKVIMLGLMMVTALFSMFMSNTATTAMMLSLLAPVLAVLPADDPGRVAFALSIPISANIGGLGTPIGTPPNVIGLKFIAEQVSISFGKWMLFGVPFVIIMLVFAWWVLCRLFAPRQKTVELVISGKFMKSWRAYVTYVTFAATILMWLLSDLHGINTYVVAMIPVGVFTATGIITKEDLKSISWDVLWLLSGGIALGLALEKTGLASRMVSNIPFGSFGPFIVLLAAMFIANFMSNFISNTATANLLMPIMAALAAGLSGLEPFGGSAGLLLAVVFSCSLGMCLPISTPPNALASATGVIETRSMAIVGLCIAVVGSVGVLVMLRLLSLFGVIG